MLIDNKIISVLTIKDYKKSLDGSIKSTYLSSHRILSTGTHLGDGFYGKATGKKVIYRAIADCLVVNNKIVEEWIIRDEASILNQLGFKVSDFVEQRINDGTFKKNDVETTKNSFIQRSFRKK